MAWHQVCVLCLNPVYASRTVDEIRADLEALQAEAEGLLDQIVGKGQVT